MRFSAIRDFLAWAPDSLVAATYLGLTALVTFVVMRIAGAALRRVVKLDRPVLRAFLRKAGGLPHFAVVLLVAALVAPGLPIDRGTAEAFHRFLTAAFVVLSGWIAIVASDLVIERYVRRFKIDIDDNLLARKAVTQMRVLKRAADVLIAVITAGFALMTFDTVRQYGISLFASAGVAALVVGMAAKPLLSNLIAGVQLAITQPIRIDDAVVVESEWGWIEELTATYVVIRLWDWRRLIVPLSYFLEKPFQNWTRVSSSIVGSVFFYLDHTAQIEPIREKLNEILKESKNWDGRVVNLQVTNSTDHAVEIRILASSRNSSLSWDLRCELREKLLAFLQKEYPEVLPRLRA
jgi:small-conductance mechanosensitive channel